VEHELRAVAEVTTDDVANLNISRAQIKIYEAQTPRGTTFANALWSK
jgi:hypothetical protein